MPTAPGRIDRSLRAAPGCEHARLPSLLLLALITAYFDRRENARSGEQYGSVAAVDPASGEVVWQQRTTRPLGGGLVATAGGLVFAGQTSGWFDAYDDRTGERVWSFHVGASCNAAPITYRVGGRQYVAVACGGHEVLDPDGGDTIIAFALVQ